MPYPSTAVSERNYAIAHLYAIPFIIVPPHQGFIQLSETDGEDGSDKNTASPLSCTSCWRFPEITAETLQPFISFPPHAPLRGDAFVLGDDLCLD
jgi:hypothetical protein